MRLIDADALLIRMYEEAFEKDSEEQRWDGGCWIRYKMFEKAVDSAPTIDPVKKGTLKERRGDYVIYQVDYLLDNLAREIYLLEAYRKSKKNGGGEE